MSNNVRSLAQAIFNENTAFAETCIVLTWCVLLGPSEPRQVPFVAMVAILYNLAAKVISR